MYSSTINTSGNRRRHNCIQSSCTSRARTSLVPLLPQYIEGSEKPTETPTSKHRRAHKQIRHHKTKIKT